MCFRRRRIQVGCRVQETSSLRGAIKVVERDTQIVEYLKRIRGQLVDSSEKTSGPFILLAFGQHSSQGIERLRVRRGGSFYQVGGCVGLADAIGSISHIE